MKLTNFKQTFVNGISFYVNC